MLFEKLFEFATYLGILMMYHEDGENQMHTGSLPAKPEDLAGLFILKLPFFSPVLCNMRKFILMIDF